MTPHRLMQTPTERKPKQMKEIKYDQFIRLPNHEKTRVYFSHEFNTVRGKGQSVGPSVTAQAEFHNDWQAAFARFASRLPN